ncbi:MAG: hypothetical protein HUU50_12475 [Candidatus Brocadiae bacterium]|nr:hypothetical protein [Candidatus Brocadiia bacterium]
MHDEYNDYQQLSKALIRDLRLMGEQYFSFYMIGMASLRISIINNLVDEESKIELLEIAKSCIFSIPIQYIGDKDKFFNQLLNAKIEKLIQIQDFLYSLNPAY